jgi:hypothetical protein
MAVAITESVRAAAPDGCPQPPSSKRIRLDSVVVRREGEKPSAASTRHHRASWSTGSLPANRGRGGDRGGRMRGGFGRGRWRGGRRPYWGRGKRGR